MLPIERDMDGGTAKGWIIVAKLVTAFQDNV